MKILAIRGRNLASLADEFEVDFRKEPLASTGLFAICGPTGSGKSTLLDALSVALYGDTPRLSKATGKGVGLPDVGDETITPSDARTLLRRGAAEGYAEVDFVGSDNVELRARWSVRRAHGRADKRLQPAEMSLVRLSDSQPIGKLKSEVLEEIQARLGLSFQQFTRAVLLAQNEFYAFLKADDNERASLLETLTGTDAYSGISMRAYDRAKTEQDALEHLQELLADQKPLEPVARGQLERENSEAMKAAADLETQKAELCRYRDWYNLLDQHRQAEQRAQFDSTRVEENKKAAGPRITKFIRIEYVQNAKPFVTELDRVSAEVEKSEKGRRLAEQQLAAANKECQDAETLLIAAKQAVVEAEQAKTLAAVDLDRAKTCDATIKAKEPAYSQAEKNYTAAQKAEKNAASILKSKQDELNTASRQLEEAVQWLEQNSKLRQLAENWPRWDVLFSQAGKTLTELETADEAIVKAERDELAKNKILSEASVNLKTAEAVLREAEGNYQASSLSLEKSDPEALAVSRKKYDSRRDMLITGSQIWQELAGRLSQKSNVEREAGEQREALAHAQAALSAAVEQKPSLIAALAQAEKSQTAAALACSENVEKVRSTLESGSPCPVCGSTDHPYSVKNPSDVVLDSLEAEVVRCRQDVKEIERQETTQIAVIEKTRKFLAANESEFGKLNKAIETDSAALKAHPISGNLEAISEEQRPEWFKAEIQAVQNFIKTLEAEEEAYRKAVKAKNQAQLQLDTTRSRYVTVQQAETAAKGALEQSILSKKAENEKRMEIAGRLERVLDELDVLFPAQEWRKDLRANPDGFHQQEKKSAETWIAHRKRADELQSGIGKLEIEIRGLSEAAIKSSEQVRSTFSAFSQADNELKDLREQRRQLFDGRSTAEVEAALKKKTEEAKIRQQTLDVSSQNALKRQARAVEAHGQAKERRELLQQSYQVAEQALSSWIKNYNSIHSDSDPLNLVELRELVAFDGEWIARERDALRQLDIVIERASAVLRERKEQRENHEQTRPTQDSIEVVQEALNNNSIQLEAAKASVAELGLKLRMDDERRKKSEALLSEIAVQEAKTKTWAQLNELIGSADGKKFRNYAQRFTLDVLLGYANRHLLDLSRRYRLQRVNETLSLLVVDQDMGGETRSVHSLSGGESFLISLALALGLASLSSNRVKVESLFIDEGFGSLDTETLRTAMDALDSLQAQGRKVGVISHVEEMTERIGTQIQVKRLSGGQSRVLVTNI